PPCPRGSIIFPYTTLFRSQFLTDEVLREHLPCMPYCAVWFADDQIREQATLAGNVVNASPAADGTPPLLAMDGEIEIARLAQGSIERRSRSEERRVGKEWRSRWSSKVSKSNLLVYISTQHSHACLRS